jgi:hypothetical protein
MIGSPKTLKEARKQRFGAWAGNPKGHAFVEGQCSYQAYDEFTHHFYQCTRKAKTGPANLYCKQHAKMIERDNA